MNEISLNWDQVMAMAESRFVPMNATLELIYQCNLKCVHCYQSHLPGNILTTDEIKAVIDDLADLGSLYLGFTGGEPLLRKDFFDIATHARERHFVMKVLTNATLLTAENVARLAELNFSSVETSVYGATAAVHEDITKIPGSFEATWNGVRLAREAGIHVVTKMPIMDGNFDDVAKVRDMAGELETEFHCDFHISPTTSGSFAPCRKRITTEQLKQILPSYEHYLAIKENGGKGRDSLLCKTGRSVVSISARGDVYPCEGLYLSCGNVREKSLKEIWKNSDVMKDLRHLTDEDFEECKSCPVMNFCHRCMGQVHLETGSYLKKSEDYCRAAKTMHQAFVDGV